MKPKIAIIDYGMGNLRSVSKAVELCGGNVNIISDADSIKDYNSIILPGVGAFEPAIKILNQKGLDIAIKEHIKNKKMFLGICLGFQLLFSESYEDGLHKGLNIVEGSVEKFVPKQNEKLIIPHMGWNKIFISKTNNTVKEMYNNIKDESYVYFVHSYYCKPTNKEYIATTTNHSIDFCSSIAKENVWGCQFHPEKSSEIGLQLLKNFVSKCEVSNGSN